MPATHRLRSRRKALRTINASSPKKYVKLAVIAFIIANILWGFASPIFKWSLEDIPPFTFAFLRFAIPAVLIGVFGFKYLRIKAKHIPLIIGVSICDVSLNVGLFFIALKHTQSINAPIIGSAGPIFLILASMFMLKEKPTRKLLLGNLIGLTGVLLIVVQPVLQASTAKQDSVFGNLLLILATISFAWGTVLAKEVRPYYPAVTIMFWSFTIGALSLFPFFWYEVSHVGFLPNFSDKGVYGLLYGSIISSMLAYFLYYWAIRHITASESGIFSYTDPVAAVILAGPLLHEFPSVIFFIGALMVFVGIYVAEGRIHYHPIHRLLR